MDHTTVYKQTIPIFIKFLENLETILTKAQKFSVAKGGKAEQTLISEKLAPDMYGLVQQVGYAYFTTLEATTNLTGIKAPELGYDEKSIKELRSSIVRVITFLKTIKARSLEHSDGKRIKTFLDAKKSYSRDVYVRELALPNFFFHVTATYAILRHLGVTLGKKDYLGN